MELCIFVDYENNILGLFYFYLSIIYESNSCFIFQKHKPYNADDAHDSARKITEKW